MDLQLPLVLHHLRFPGTLMFKRFVDGVEVLVALVTAFTVVLLFTLQPTVAQIESPDSAVGAGLYAARCAACHGPSGEGGTGPALALDRFVSADDVAAFVSAGVPGAMPGFATRLSPDEINAIVEYVWSDLAGQLIGSVILPGVAPRSIAR
jgi:mono/diheme cytochrome c family protein